MNTVLCMHILPVLRLSFHVYICIDLYFWLYYVLVLILYISYNKLSLVLFVYGIYTAEGRAYDAVLVIYS